MEETKVVALNPHAPLKGKMHPKANKPFCAHESIEVDEEHRVVNCQLCGAVIDPFDYLWGAAMKEYNHLWHANEVKKELEELRKQKDVLQREVNNLKAQKRRLI